MQQQTFFDQLFDYPKASFEPRTREQPLSPDVNYSTTYFRFKDL